MRFECEQIRGDQLAAEVGAATGLSLTTDDITYYLDGHVEVRAPEQYRDAIAAVVAAHVPEAVWNDEDRTRVHMTDARDRWNLAALKSKSPAKIYTLMQSRMDTWANLADARRDLREWLPLIAAAVAWCVMEES